MNEEMPANIYAHPEIAAKYHRKGGFAPEHKSNLLAVALDLLIASGFTDCECPWHDFWLAVFVARKPDSV